MMRLLHLYAFHLHVFVSLVGIFGMALLCAWAIKTLPPARLYTVAWWTFAIGAVGVLITVPFCLAGWNLIMHLPIPMN